MEKYYDPEAVSIEPAFPPDSNGDHALIKYINMRNVSIEPAFPPDSNNGLKGLKDHT